MEVCYSHNTLCGCMFVGNATDGVKDVSVHEISKGGVEKEKGCILVELIQQVIKVMLMEDNEIMNVLGVTKKEEMFKSGVDVEHCWVRMLKEMMWIFATEMGREGCPICTCFSLPFR